MNPSRVEIIGQRGSGGQAPSGTGPAIQAALRTGVTGLELEVQFAADSVPFVCFERTLERVAGVKGTIRNQTARELAGYDVGFRYGDRYRGLRLLTMEEAADMVPQGVDLHLEIRDHESVNPKHLRGLLSVLKAHGGLERCTITSRSEAILASLASTDPEVTRGLKTSGSAPEAPEKAAALGCRSLHPEASATRRDLVDACRGKGLRVYPHTANDMRAIRSLVDLGVDGLATDQPERVADALRGGGDRHREPRRQEPVAIESEPEAAGRTEGAEGMESPRAPRVDEAQAAPRRRRRRRAGSRRHEEHATPSPPAEAPAQGPPPRTADRSDEAVAPQPRESAAAPASDAPDASAAVAADGTAIRPRRRRGRRGGRREQARRARRAAVNGSPVDGAGDPIPLEPVEEEEEPLELLGEVHAELSVEEGESPSGAAPPGGGPGGAPRRRRRGRRGGRRIQERRQRGPEGGGEPAP